MSSAAVEAGQRDGGDGLGSCSDLGEALFRQKDRDVGVRAELDGAEHGGCLAIMVTLRCVWEGVGGCGRVPGVNRDLQKNIADCVGAGVGGFDVVVKIAWEGVQNFCRGRGRVTAGGRGRKHVGEAVAGLVVEVNGRSRLISWPFAARGRRGGLVVVVVAGVDRVDLGRL